MKRSVQDETTMDALKRAQMERTQMEMCPMNNTTTLSLGAQQKEIVPNISKRKVKQEKRHSQNKATRQQEDSMTNGYVHKDRTPDNFDRGFRELEKIHSSSKDGKPESESRLLDVHYLTDIYMSDESEKGGEDIIPSTAH